MKHQLRLGPIAIFLTIVAAVLATLAMLTVSTSRADVVLARRFAQTTAIRYDLEARGNQFLEALDQALAAGDGADEELAGLEGVQRLENGNYLYRTSQDDYDLTVEVAPDAASAGYDLISWKISRQWDENDSMGSLWSGNGKGR